jgi:hypothetical protein
MVSKQVTENKFCTVNLPRRRRVQLQRMLKVQGWMEKFKRAPEHQYSTSGFRFCVSHTAQEFVPPASFGRECHDDLQVG